METSEDSILNKMAIETEMRKDPESFSRDRIIALLKNGIFTKDELCQKGLMIEKAIHLLQDDGYLQSLPDIHDIVNNNNSHIVDGTDIFFIGIPSSGKTCLLMSLLNSKRVWYDSLTSGGRYADYLIQFCRNGLFPCRTPNSTLIINAHVTDKEGRKRRVNLIDIPGEALFYFTQKIQSGKLLTHSEKEECDIVQELIQNRNPKIFYFVIDPTIDSISFTNVVPIYSTSLDKDGNEISEIIEWRQNKINIIQEEELKLFIDFIFQHQGKNILQLIKAKHIIVTKSDKLGETEDERFRNILSTDKRLLFERLVSSMSEYNKNKSTGVLPKLYTHSIGTQYPGGIFENNTSDADKIISSICNSTPYETNSWFSRLTGCKFKYPKKNEMEEDGGIILNY